MPMLGPTSRLTTGRAIKHGHPLLTASCAQAPGESALRIAVSENLLLPSTGQRGGAVLSPIAANCRCRGERPPSPPGPRVASAGINPRAGRVATSGRRVGLATLCSHRGWGAFSNQESQSICCIPAVVCQRMSRLRIGAKEGGAANPGKTPGGLTRRRTSGDRGCSGGRVPAG